MSATQDCELLKLRAATREFPSIEDLGVQLMISLNSFQPDPPVQPRDWPKRLNGICKRGHDTKLPENQYKRGRYIDCAACDRMMASVRRRRLAA